MRSFRISVLMTCLFCLILGACSTTVNGGGSNNPVPLSGKMGSDSRTMSGVRTVLFDMVGNLTITQGTEEELTVNADEKLLPIITSTVNNGTLTLTMNGSFKADLSKGVNIDLDLKVKQLDTLNLKGAGNIKVLNLNVSKLTVAMSGAGSVNIAGKVAEQDISLDGAGSYDSVNTKSQNAMVHLSGVGSVKVRVSSVLDATMSGLGSIEYIGNPTTLNKHISGFGQVKQVSQ